MNGTEMALAVGAGFVATEATGLTDVTGGGGGTSIIPQIDAGLSGLELPDQAGLSSDVLAALQGESPIGGAVLDQLVEQANQATGDIIQVPTADDLTNPFDQFDQSPNGSEPTGPPGSPGNPNTTGGNIGKNIGGFFWQSSVGPLARSIDQNVPGFGGNAEENINTWLTGIENVVPHAEGDLTESINSATNGGLTQNASSNALDGITNADSIDEISDTISGGVTGNSSSNAADRAQEIISGGISGDSETNLTDALIGDQADEGPITTPVTNAVSAASETGQSALERARENVNLSTHGVGSNIPDVDVGGGALSGGLNRDSGSNVTDTGLNNSSDSNVTDTGLTGDEDSNVIDASRDILSGAPVL